MDETAFVAFEKSSSIIFDLIKGDQFVCDYLKARFPGGAIDACLGWRSAPCNVESVLKLLQEDPCEFVRHHTKLMFDFGFSSPFIKMGLIKGNYAQLSETLNGIFNNLNMECQFAGDRGDNVTWLGNRLDSMRRKNPDLASSKYWHAYEDVICCRLLTKAIEKWSMFTFTENLSKFQKYLEFTQRNGYKFRKEYVAVQTACKVIEYVLWMDGSVDHVINRMEPIIACIKDFENLISVLEWKSVVSYKYIPKNLHKWRKIVETMARSRGMASAKFYKKFIDNWIENFKEQVKNETQSQLHISTFQEIYQWREFYPQKYWNSLVHPETTLNDFLQ